MCKIWKEKYVRSSLIIFYRLVLLLAAVLDTVKEDTGPATEQTECQAISPVVRIAPPHPQASVAPPPFGSGVTHSLAGEGVGGPNSAEGPDIVVL